MFAEDYQTTDFGDEGPRGPGEERMEKSLFEKYGGFSVVSKIVLDLYDRLLDDDDVGPFFDEIDMARIVDHQTKFVSSLMGGPASYSDEQIRRMHAHLEIHQLHFDKLQLLLRATLADHGVTPEDQEAILAAFEARRALVTG